MFKLLLKHSTRITKAVIGTHFYQTHPDVLDAFVGSENVRFVLQPTGVFHPKLYIFWNSKQWEALIGSANLTAGALSTNSEVMVLLSDVNNLSSPLRDQMISLVDGYWSRGSLATRNTATAYRDMWTRKQPALRRLAGQYGESKPKKPPTASAVMSMSWPRFVFAVKADQYHGFEKRCELLEIVRSAFRQHPNFASMNLRLRKTIAGLPNDFDDRWGWFGAMRGAGYFYQAVNDNNPHLSRALDNIPLLGLVTRTQYGSYLDEFKEAFPRGRHGLALLAGFWRESVPINSSALIQRIKRNSAMTSE